MKRLLSFLPIILCIFLFSCSKDANEPTEVDGSISFGISIPEEDGGRAITIDVSFVGYSLTNSTGELVSGVLNLTPFGESYISENLILTAGEYNLTEFYILDDQEEIVYVTPKEGSDLGMLVNDPLPINFEVDPGETVTILPEVLAVGDQSPEDFGYGSFSFGIVETQTIVLATTLALDDPSSFDYSFEIIGKENLDEDPAWVGTYEISDEDEEVSILFRKGYEYYSLIASKEGFLSHEVHFSSGELSDISKLSLELIPEDSDDFVIYEVDGFKVIFPSDPCRTYARVDIPEGYKIEYLFIDKNARDLSGLPVNDSRIIEFFGTPTSKVNLFDNVPYAQSKGYCEEVDLELSELAETLEDIDFSNLFMVNYFRSDSESEGLFESILHSQTGLEPDVD